MNKKLLLLSFSFLFTLRSMSLEERCPRLYAILHRSIKDHLADPTELQINQVLDMVTDSMTDSVEEEPLKVTSDTGQLMASLAHHSFYGNEVDLVVLQGFQKMGHTREELQKLSLTPLPEDADIFAERRRLFHGITNTVRSIVCKHITELHQNERDLNRYILLNQLHILRTVGKVESRIMDRIETSYVHSHFPPSIDRLTETYYDKSVAKGR